MTIAQPWKSPPAPDAGCDHAVAFYERDEELADRVARFIGEGLIAGEAAVIIAREAHRELFLRRLPGMNIDVEAARLSGNLTILDAEGTLAKFLVDDMPDPELFRRVVGGVIESSGTHGTKGVRVRAYGEMVDILWQRGNQRAAVALEELWDGLATVYPFDLLCAYAMAGFYKTRATALADVCDRHSHVMVATARAEGETVSGGALELGAQTRALAAEIGHRKEVERVLRNSMRELRQAEAAERARAERTKRIADDLAETVRVNELFMGVLAHDLRAPLAAIMTAAQLMKMRDAAAADGRNAKTMGRVIASGERMSRMIEQLLDFTRLRVGGGIVIEPKDADLASLVGQVAGELEDTYPDCPVRITQAGDVSGKWDVDRLGQVFSNLIANACQHGTPAAGVRVFIDGTGSDVIRVQIHNMGAIPATLVPHVFEPLTGGQRRRDRSQGLGLGLFITKRVAAAHGGEVELASNEIEGTTFTVTLPRFAKDAASETRTEVSLTADEERADGERRETTNLANLAHEQLRETEARFRLLVEAVKDYAIFMLDPNGRVVTWNAGAQRIKGYEAREIIGRHFSQFYDEAEVRAGKCERELEGAAREGRFEDEGWRIRKDGTKFWANVVITALRSPNGELLGFAKITRDLTDRRRSEQEQLKLAKAEEAIRLRDEFLSLAAHELKTPLTVLQLQLDTLSDRMDESTRVATKLQRASQSSERLSNLVESLLDVSRIATGRFALDIKEFDIVESVGRVIDSLHLPAEKARCELSLVTQEPIPGKWDQLRLEQALTNLLTNAIKYGAGKPVRISVRRNGGEVIIEVRDHGPGIPAAELGRIFQRFERAASIRNYGGLGLGLYFIQAIVDAHGGSVTANNMPDGGARFQITLPLQASVAVIEGPAQQADVN
jgi:PAS domain S-box-containing protein